MSPNHYFKVMPAGDHVDLILVNVLDELIASLMETKEPVQTISRLMAIALLILGRLNGDPVPRYVENPELVQGYLLMRKMIRMGVFDKEVIMNFIKVSRELRRH